ncbi:SecY subunit domain-containing protein [Phellopilus nigrolimitatus]|nr:SecY subunit domain-containing protein [Phellopilus nigrolimitatus]
MNYSQSPGLDLTTTTSNSKKDLEWSWSVLMPSAREILERDSSSDRLKSAESAHLSTNIKSYGKEKRIILESALVSDVFIVSQMLASRFPDNLPMRLLGVWEPLEDSPQVWATGGIAYYICPHRTHFVSGSGPRDVVKQLNDQQMVIAGHWEGSMYKELKRVIPMAVAFGGAILGLLSVAADFLVTISSGTGILMVVTIYSYCEIDIHKSSSPEMAAFGDLLDWFSFSLPLLSRTCARTYGSVRYVLLRSELGFCSGGLPSGTSSGIEFRLG